MSDVRLVATNPEDSSIVPVAVNANGQLLLEDPLTVEGPEGPRGPEGPEGPSGEDGKDGQDGDSFVPDPSGQANDLVLTTLNGGCGWLNPPRTGFETWYLCLSGNGGAIGDIKERPKAFDGSTSTSCNSAGNGFLFTFPVAMHISQLSFTTTFPLSEYCCRINGKSDCVSSPGYGQPINFTRFADEYVQAGDIMEVTSNPQQVFPITGISINNMTLVDGQSFNQYQMLALDYSVRQSPTYFRELFAGLS